MRLLDEPVLEVRSLGKCFANDLRSARREGLRGVLSELLPGVMRRKGKADEHEVLKDISFEIRSGESLAILGGNGEGKTTLLRIIAGLIKPGEGSVVLRARVSSVIELGAGLNSLLTGRENAKLLLTWHGHPDVVAGVRNAREFAGLGDKFDTPVQYYSSGMRARLAYAIAVQNEAELLLLDEALAVGDQDFQDKCLHHIDGHLKRGGSLIFVSHNPDLVFQCCSRALVLHEGRVAKSGDVASCLDYYAANAPERERLRTSGAGATPISVSVEAARWRDEHIEADLVICSDRPLRFRLITSLSNNVFMEVEDSLFADLTERTAGEGVTRFSYRLPFEELPPSVNFLGAMIMDAETGVILSRTGLHGGYAHVYQRPAERSQCADADAELEK